MFPGIGCLTNSTGSGPNVSTAEKEFFITVIRYQFKRFNAFEIPRVSMQAAAGFRQAAAVFNVRDVRVVLRTEQLSGQQELQLFLGPVL